MPRALRWSHNAYYHRKLTGSLRSRVDSALDVGCGYGDLPASLATKANRVDAVDRSPAMIELARRRHPDAANWLIGDVLTERMPLETQGYDLVTSVSALHHMPLSDGLGRLAGLVAPGGLLVVIGLHKPVTLPDFAMDAVSIPANGLVGLWLWSRGRGGKEELGMPMMDSTYTFGQLTAAAEAITPGAVVRRRLHFRHSLVWRRPPTSQSGDHALA